MPKQLHAKARAPTSHSKTPKTVGVHARHDGDPVFCFRHTDRKTEPPYFKPSEGQSLELLDFICSMAKRRWSDIEADRVRSGNNRHKKHHSQAIETLSEPARKALAKTKLDEIFGEDIFRFHLSGEKRLWGFRSGDVFHVLWWDPDHAVYPTEIA